MCNRRVWIFLVTILVGSSAFALEGDVDPTFGTAGQVVIQWPGKDVGGDEKPTGDLVTLADGRFIWTAPLDDGTLWVGRSWRDGTPDTSFGDQGNGRITLPICGLSFRPARLINDGANGAILWSDRCLRRILDDGTTDKSFGLGDMPPSTFIAADLARETSGGLLLVGREDELATAYRFDDAGTVDNTLGIAGRVVVTAPAGGWKSVNTMLSRPDGRILIGGSGGISNEHNLLIGQLNSDGSPDSTWGEDGFVIVEPPQGFHTLDTTAMALDTDGSLVVAGKGNNSAMSCCILLTRFSGTGQIVPDFGLRLFGLSGSPRLFPSGEQRDQLVILPNHRIIVGTIAFPFVFPENHRTQYTLVRTFADGNLDPGFGHDGWNSYTIVESAGASPAGDYNQMHAIGYDNADGSMLIIGRTFFEDFGFEGDYISMVRARFDLVFDGGFE